MSRLLLLALILTSPCLAADLTDFLTPGEYQLVQDKEDLTLTVWVKGEPASYNITDWHGSTCTLELTAAPPAFEKLIGSVYHATVVQDTLYLVPDNEHQEVISLQQTPAGIFLQQVCRCRGATGSCTVGGCGTHAPCGNGACWWMTVIIIPWNH